MNKDEAIRDLHDARVKQGQAEEAYLEACGWVKYDATNRWFHEESRNHAPAGMHMPRIYAVDAQENHDLREAAINADLTDPRVPDAE